MQGEDPRPLVQAINQITTLESLSLDLEGSQGQQPPVQGETEPVIQLCLPKLVILTMKLAVGRVDARLCPLIWVCTWSQTPAGARHAAAPWLDDIVPEGLPPADDDEAQALHEAWREQPGPYASCPQDGILFARNGKWSYSLQFSDSWEKARHNSPWDWMCTDPKFPLV